MSEIQVASRYAKSLIDLAEEQNAVEKVKTDIDFFISTLKKNPTLQAVLKNPIIGPDKKAAILSGVFGSNVHQLILEFFKIVVRKGRSKILYATALEFVNDYNRRKNIVKATVTSAAELSEENKNAIEKVISQATKGQVLLISKVNRDLIGGFILRVGDKQFDASISSQLNKLKKDFAHKI